MRLSRSEVEDIYIYKPSPLKKPHRKLKEAIIGEIIGENSGTWSGVGDLRWWITGELVSCQFKKLSDCLLSISKLQTLIALHKNNCPRQIDITAVPGLAPTATHHPFLVSTFTSCCYKKENEHASDTGNVLSATLHTCYPKNALQDLPMKLLRFSFYSGENRPPGKVKEITRVTTYLK